MSGKLSDELQNVANCWIDWPQRIPAAGQWIQGQWPQLPTACQGDVHVFPCQHCDKCKCGKATVTRDKR